MLFLLYILLCFWRPSEGSINSKIVNGTDALPGENPHVVSIRYFEMHECGGSIIGERWVLTAAHCIYPGFINESTILYGTIYLQNGRSPDNYVAAVLNAYRHDRYVPSGGYENDIGLVELKKSIYFNEYVSSIRLPAYSAPTPAWSEAILVGWGFPETDGDVMEVLQAVNILIFSEESCKGAHDPLVNPLVHICAGVIEGGKGQCTGDSGGPLTVNKTQYGIVSWSVKPCTLAGFPGVFTRVSTYRQWIYEKTGI